MTILYSVIVTYNGIPWISKCLESICSSSIPINVIIIDNGSTDGTLDLIKSNYKNVELISLENNLGFGKANNIGIEKALSKGAEYVFLLNQDAYLFKGSVESSVKILEDEKSVGIVSPLHYANDGINLDVSFYKYVAPAKTPNLIGDMINKSDLQQYYMTDFINAAAWLVKSSVFKELGGFHPVFSHYGEDTEFIMRMHKNNWKICVDPLFSIIHDRPQNRNENKFFNLYRTLDRSILLERFKNGSVNKTKVIKKFMQLFFFYLRRGRFSDCIQTVRTYLNTVRSIKLANREIKWWSSY